MNEFENHLNELLVDVFHQILKFEEASLASTLGASATMTEAHILEVIGKQHEEMTVSAIAAALNITLPTATVALKKLESKGLVTKSPCINDARKYMIGLTKEGKIINRAHDMFHKTMISHMSEDLADSEKEALLSAVKKLTIFFREKVKD